MEKEKLKTDKLDLKKIIKLENMKDDFKEVVELRVKSKKGGLLVIVLTAILLGAATGYYLSRPNSPLKEDVKREVTAEEIKPGVTVGVADEKSFKDSAEGQLQSGGIDGEGSHHLVRPGGDSQNVYLTSSIIDLEKFTDHKVKVWGQTFSAQKAGWLMDVGKLKVLE